MRLNVLEDIKYRAEICTCGHMRSDHAGAMLHGFCEHATIGGDFCKCDRFTWDGKNELNQSRLQGGVIK